MISIQERNNKITYNAPFFIPKTLNPDENIKKWQNFPNDNNFQTIAPIPTKVVKKTLRQYIKEISTPTKKNPKTKSK